MSVWLGVGCTGPPFDVRDRKRNKKYTSISGFPPRFVLVCMIQIGDFPTHFVCKYMFVFCNCNVVYKNMIMQMIF